MRERGVIREGSGPRELPGFGVETEEGTVAAFMVSNLLTLAENRGVAADALLAGTNIQSEFLAEPDTQVAWSAFVQIGRNACRIWSDSELVELGNQYVHLETAIPLLDLALAVHDPLEFYKWLTDSGRYRTILRMEERSEIIGRDRLRLEIEMPPGHESCPMYLLIQKGFFEEVSTLLGCGPADVRLETNAHGAVFEIRVPVLSAPWPRLRYWLRRVRGVFTSQERMIGAIDRLRRRNGAARRRIHVLDAKLVELDRSRERFDLLFRSAPTAMLISRATDDYAVLDVNDKFLASTGYDRESVTKWTQHQLGMWVKSEDRDAVFGKVLDGGGRIEGVEVCVEHASGHEMVALLSVELVELSGEPCLLWQAVDITLRKQHERELALYRERLEELVEERSEELKRSLESLQQFERLASVGTLAAGIAHQINNPVAAIRAASEFALMTGDDPEAVKGYREALETCVEQADRCGEITRNILRFSRGEASVRVPVDLRTIVLRSCDLVASYAHEGGATLHVDVGDEEISVRVNAVEIEQVIVNVLRNAVESGGGKTRIEVIARRLQTGAFVEIRDDGPGIDKDQLPFLFDPFYTTRLEAGGTGLGLSVAHGIVNAHGGAIRADDQLDHGTAIQVQLPLNNLGAAFEAPTD